MKKKICAIGIIILSFVLLFSLIYAINNKNLFIPIVSGSIFINIIVMSIFSTIINTNK